MEKIEIQFDDLYYILIASRKQLKQWIKEFDDKKDEIIFNKVENIMSEIMKSPATIFEIKEGNE